MSENEVNVPEIAQPGLPDINPQTIIGDSIKEGWGAFKSRAGLLIGMTFVLILISAAGSGMIQAIFKDNQVVLNLSQQLLSLLVVNVISAGFVFSSLKMVRKEEVQFGELFSGFSHYGSLVFANFLYVLGVALGFVLLIVPGVILALGWGLYILMVMDKGHNGTTALRESWALTKGFKGKLFLFFLAVVGINILGVLALVVGIFVSMPVSACAFAAFYNRLSQIKEASEPIG